MSNTENLKGKTILIGKEPGNGRLFVCVKVNGQPKVAAIGEMNSVPNSVSRCKPAENVAHCKIDIDAAGNMIVTNLKEQNTTCVNGLEIMSKKITLDSMLELGKDHYSIGVKPIVDAAAKLVVTMAPHPQPPHEEVSIRHLEQVWDVYNGKLREIKIRLRNNGLLSRVPMAFTMFGGLISGVAPDDIRPFALSFTGIALIVFLIGLYRHYKDRSIEEMEEITEEFQKNYVCPKAGCHHFLGTQPYRILRQNKKCPYCGCGFNEK